MKYTWGWWQSHYLCRYFCHKKLQFWSEHGARWKVEASPKVWMSLPHFMAIYPIVVKIFQFGPKVVNQATDWQLKKLFTWKLFGYIYHTKKHLLTSQKELLHQVTWKTWTEHLIRCCCDYPEVCLQKGSKQLPPTNLDIADYDIRYRHCVKVWQFR